jgi:hypothetical protein
VREGGGWLLSVFMTAQGEPAQRGPIEIILAGCRVTSLKALLERCAA